MIQLEDTLAQVRKEYEMLRIEFEQTLAANEQAGTIILAPPCIWLLQMLSLKDTIWSPGFVSTNWSSEVLENLKSNPVIHFCSQPECLFLTQIGQFCFHLLRRSLGNSPYFLEVPDVFCPLSPY